MMLQLHSPATGSLPLDTAIESYLYALAALRRSPDYVKLNRQVLGQFLRFAPTLTIDGVTRLLVRQWSSSLDCKQSTVKEYLSLVSYFLGWLVQEEELLVNPLAGMKMPRPDAVLPRVFSREEVGRLIAAMTGPQRDRNVLLCQFLYGTGARITEALTLTWEQVEPTTIKFFGKGRKERRVPLDERLAAALDAWRGDASDSALVFGGLKPGRAEQLLHEAGMRARVHDVHPHAFRHSFATEVIKAGVPVTTVQRWLGHSNIATTMVYVNLQESDTLQIRPRVLCDL